MPDVRRYADPETLFQSLKLQFLALAHDAIGKKGSFNVAVSGGSSPLTFFRLLAAAQAGFTEWQKVNFFWVDERWVPAGHAENNYSSAMKSGLEKLPARYIPFNTSLQTPEIACHAYALEMQNMLSAKPEFDLVILGSGTDGHTASIFADDIPKAMADDVVIVTNHPVTGQIRLTITFQVIFNAKEVILLLVGREKKAILDRLLERRQPHYPIEFAIFGAKSNSIFTDINDY